MSDKQRSFISKIGSVVKRVPWLDSKLQVVRRKILAEGSGYPAWGKILSNKDDNWQQTLLSIDKNKKVLIATSIGSHLAAMQMETSLAVALTLRKSEVHVLLCDGILPGCQMCEPRFFLNAKSFVQGGPQTALCKDCFAPGKRIYEQIGVKVHAYSDYITPADRTRAKKIVLETPYKGIESLTLEGISIGEQAKAGALRFFARATLEEEPLGEQVLRRYLEAALLTAIATRKLLTELSFEVAVFHHGIYVPQGIIGEVARQEGVRVVNWNPAYRKNCFIFSHETTYHHTLMTESTAVWEEMEWSKQKEATISLYLKSRWEGDNDWIRFHENPYFEKDKILTEIGCDTGKPLVGLLTNVMWDAQLHYPANAFNNMLEWLLFTVRWFESRPDLQLVIRVHPAEIRGSVPTRQPVVDELKKYFPQLPSNVFIVPPESNISTYVLSEMCNAVIIYGTKTGVELAGVGIPVIVAGEAWIRNKGITLDAENVKEYSNLLEQLPFQQRMNEDQIEHARKYAYHFFFRRMIPVNIFEKGPGWPPYEVAIGGIYELSQGSDPGLDLICDGILFSTPFVYNAN